jgi:hypothetical protein
VTFDVVDLANFNAYSSALLAFSERSTGTRIFEKEKDDIANVTPLLSVYAYTV